MIKKQSVTIFILLMLVLYLGIDKYIIQPIHKTENTTTVVHDTLYKIDYTFVYKPDTVYAPSKVDTIFQPDTTIINTVDTLYIQDEKVEYSTVYEVNTDSVDYTLNIYSESVPKWYTLDLKIKDKIKITEDGTLVADYGNTKIEYVKKETWKNKIKLTPQIGLGYGLTHKQTDVYVGFGISYCW